MAISITPPKVAPDRPANGKSHGITSKTILITGAAGFIGSNFARYIFRKYPDYKIIAYDALTYAGNVDNFTPEMRDSERFEFVYGNVCNAAQVADVMTYVDTVVHFAAETHVTRSIYDSNTFFETDVLGTANLASAAVKNRSHIDRFIHISTSEVYGSCRGSVELMDEDHPLEPCSPYASAKTGADRLVYSYWKTYDLPGVIVRPFNNYGPRQHLEKVIPRFVTSAILNEPLTVHGTGFSSRDWIYVQDTCEAIDVILHAPLGDVAGQAFNLGTGIDTDVLSIAKRIIALMGRSEDLIQWIGDRPGQVEKHRADASKIQRVLNWAPKVQLDDGLAKTIEWYEQNENFWRRQMWLRRIKIVTSAGREFH